MNLFICSGRLTKDPDMRSTQTGKSIATFALAIDVGYGEYKHTMFLNCQSFGKTAETIVNHLNKGDQIFAEGELDQYEYEEKKYFQFKVLKFEFGKKKGENFGRESNPVHNSNGVNNNGSVAGRGTEKQKPNIDPFADKQNPFDDSQLPF